MPRSLGITSSMNTVFLWHVHLGMAQPEARVIFSLQLKGMLTD